MNNLALFKAAVPSGTIGGFLAVSTFIGLKGDEFSILDVTQLLRMLNLFVGQFIIVGTAFLVGLKTPIPWNGQERRTGEIPVVKP